MFILLTGSHHAGKTTACWKALPGLRATGVKIAGFVSTPILDETGAKTGIEMVDLTTGKHQKFARVVGIDEPRTIGVYRLVDGAIEWARGVLAAALLADVDWLVVDEIGPLELHQGAGFAFALDALADPERIPNAIVLVREELVEELAGRLGRSDMVRLKVTEANRSDIPNQLVKLVRATQATTG
jgi:nucleoside-triphosphatase THEP1